MLQHAYQGIDLSDTGLDSVAGGRVTCDEPGLVSRRYQGPDAHFRHGACVRAKGVLIP